MPSTVAEAERPMWPAGWETWKPAPCPDLPGFDPWASIDAPWKRSVLNDAPDQVRTQRLLDHPDSADPIGASVDYWDGQVYGDPYQRVDNVPMTSVVDLRKPWWAHLLGQATFKLPLPPVVRREGDPANEGPFSDLHWLGVDLARGLLYEAISLGKPWWTGKWQAAGYGVFDLSKPWRTQGRGTTAGDIPIMAMLPRVEALLAGRVDHALHLVVGNYDPSFVGPARGSDGTVKGHPLRGGERLRLRADRVPKRALSLPEQGVIHALRNHGAFVDDKTAQHKGGFRVPQDPRLLGALDLRFRLDDFEVVTRPGGE